MCLAGRFCYWTICDWAIGWLVWIFIFTGLYSSCTHSFVYQLRQGCFLLGLFHSCMPSPYVVACYRVFFCDACMTHWFFHSLVLELVDCWDEMLLLFSWRLLIYVCCLCQNFAKLTMNMTLGRRARLECPVLQIVIGGISVPGCRCQLFGLGALTLKPVVPLYTEHYVPGLKFLMYCLWLGDWYGFFTFTGIYLFVLHSLLRMSIKTKWDVPLFY